MLVEFSVENYKSIGEKQTLSLESFRKSASTNMTFETGNKEAPILNKVAAIWGANASGKTNLMFALHDYSQIGQDEFTINNKSKHKFGDYPNEPITFECKFLVDGILFHHTFVFLTGGVFSENLRFKASGSNKQWRELFGRKYESMEKVEDRVVINYEWSFNSSLITKRVKEILQSTRNYNSILTSLNVETNNYLELFKSFFDTKLESVIDFGRADGFEMFMGANFYDFISNLDNDKKVELMEFYNKLDFSFSDIQTPEIEKSEEAFQNVFKKGSSLKFYTKYDKDIPFDYLQLSHGTRTILEQSSKIMTAMQNGGTIVFDELDSSIHSQLLESIIKLFESEETNPLNAQLIFTTHNTNILSSGLLAKDQIWFTEKNDQMQTELYSLSSYPARETENFEKGYLSGRYGAVPNL